MTRGLFLRCRRLRCDFGRRRRRHFGQLEVEEGQHIKAGSITAGKLAKSTLSSLRSPGRQPRLKRSRCPSVARV